MGEHYRDRSTPPNRVACTYSVPTGWWEGRSSNSRLYATQVADSNEAALARLREDDHLWRHKDVKLESSTPTSEPITPPGEIAWNVREKKPGTEAPG